ncbi:MAG: hypothetical protein K2W82_17470 [Candidatus Obscuribacterales bacterium]|nr:hypothetical protein [Candidatus Obscuribacterales bacterium]
MSQATLTTQVFAITGDRRHTLQLPKGAKILRFEGNSLVAEFDPNVTEVETVVLQSARIGETMPAYPFVGFMDGPGGSLVLRREPS